MNSTVLYTPPSSPTKDVSNPHPYSIKTTSSGLLTRSNSANSRPGLSSHCYSPVCPTSPAAFSTPKAGHRSSRSLAQPLSPQVPAQFASQGGTPDRARLPLPAYRPASLRPTRSKRDPDRRIRLGIELHELHENIILWTPSQLSCWISCATWAETDTKDKDVVDEMANFVVTNDIGGQRFLELTEDMCLELNVKHTFYPALLCAIRTLRTATGLSRPVSKGEPLADNIDTSDGSPSCHGIFRCMDRRTVDTRVKWMAATYEQSLTSSPSDSELLLEMEEGENAFGNGTSLPSSIPREDSFSDDPNGPSTPSDRINGVTLHSFPNEALPLEAVEPASLASSLGVEDLHFTSVPGPDIAILPPAMTTDRLHVTEPQQRRTLDDPFTSYHEVPSIQSACRASLHHLPSFTHGDLHTLRSSTHVPLEKDTTEVGENDMENGLRRRHDVKPLPPNPDAFAPDKSVPSNSLEMRLAAIERRLDFLETHRLTGSAVDLDGHSQADASACTVSAQAQDPPSSDSFSGPCPGSLTSYILLVGLGMCALIVKAVYRSVGKPTRG